MKNLIAIFFLAFSFYNFSQNQNNCDTITKLVLFNSGDYSINTLADSFLLTVIDDLKSKNITNVYLSGHTDPHGSLEYNQTLSKNRVKTVEAYLLDYLDIGIKSDYYGETKLLLNDTTKVSDSLNRRVEITYYVNCYTDKDSESGTNIIYQNDENCHVDSATIHELYNKNLIGNSVNSVVVLDWTRSMYGYGFELLDWFKANTEHTNFDNIVIFNDGDGKPTSKKPLGKAGGIYHTKIDSINSVTSLMEEVANKGTGGDFPENYIEALLYAQNHFPNVDTLILIADNRACIRDYKLMGKINKPVVVILNEINDKNKLINYQYVALVAQTGGRLCFMNNELNDVKYKNNQGYKPIYFKDTTIVLPKVRGNLDEAYKQIAIMKQKQIKKSIPPIIQINGIPLPYCYTQQVPETDYYMGCVDCRKYDYYLRVHTRFIEQYTFRQKMAMKWRNRPRARFGVTKYKCNRIKCDKNKCKKIEDKIERKRCKREYIECKKKKKKCVKNKKGAKRELKKYRKCNRKIRREKFISFFKKKDETKNDSNEKSSEKKNETKNEKKEIEQ